MTWRMAITALALTGMVTACNDGGTGTASPARDSTAIARQQGSTSDAARELAERAQSRAAAQDLDGILIAEIDGRERAWTVISAHSTGKGSLSDWEPLQAGGAEVDLHGYGTPGEPWDDALELDFTIDSLGAAPALTDSQIVYFTGSATQHHTSGRGHARIEIVRAERDGNVITVSGTFSGRLGYRAFGNDDSVPDVTIEHGGFYASVSN